MGARFAVTLKPNKYTFCKNYEQDILIFVAIFFDNLTFNSAVDILELLSNTIYWLCVLYNTSKLNFWQIILKCAVPINFKELLRFGINNVCSFVSQMQKAGFQKLIRSWLPGDHKTYCCPSHVSTSTFDFLFLYWTARIHIIWCYKWKSPWRRLVQWSHKRWRRRTQSACLQDGSSCFIWRNSYQKSEGIRE